MTDALILLALLIGLELVLGVDNILVISIFVGRLPQAERNKARLLGLAFALVARILMLVILLWLAKLTTPLFLNLSVRDLILLAGGMFLLYKAVTEIHHTVELKEEQHREKKARQAFAAVITQIVLLDIVFSIDSVVTAIGLTNQLWVIVSAVIVSFAAILFAAKPIGDFIMDRPTLKILALSFLITIGITIFMEGMHKHVPKAYIYLPMGFALLVEMLQLRYENNKKRKVPEAT
ncbi:MAG: TerC family protein [Deltaproteobacteria bacterium]|nr:TerC family protein [Deltaproteobacteria bacterium]